MWAKIGQWILITLIKPALEKTLVALFKYIKNWVSEYFRKRKLKKENSKKVKRYEKATDIDDAGDSFDELP